MEPVFNMLIYWNVLFVYIIYLYTLLLYTIFNRRDVVDHIARNLFNTEHAFDFQYTPQSWFDWATAVEEGQRRRPSWASGFARKY